MFRKITFVSIITVASICLLLNACSKKMSGTFKVSGKVVDAFNGQGIAGVQLVVGNYKGGMAQPNIYSPDTTFVTSSNGEFKIQTTLNKACPRLGLRETFYDGTIIERKYKIKTPLENLSSNSRYVGSIILTNLETNNMVIEFQRLSTLKLIVTKNPSIIIDSVVFNNFTSNTKINSDTNFYFLLQPDALNHFNIKRNNNIIWQDSFAVGLAGDTIFRNVQL